MKKILSLFICMILLLSVAAAGYAMDGSTVQAVTPDDTRETVSPDPPFVVDPNHVHEWTTTITATCTEGGMRMRECPCGAMDAVALGPLGHEYGSPRKLDANSHQKVCIRCDDTVTESHSWDNGRVTKSATCQSTGTKTYTCTGCGETKSESLPVSSSHNFGSWQHTADEHIRYCTEAGCDAQESSKHSWKRTVIQQPTCEEEGIREKKCTVCGRTETILIEKLTEHTYDNACDNKCNVCGKERNTQHSYTSTWSSNSKGHWHECTKCGHQKDYSAHVPGPEATEESDQVCKTCNYVIKSKIPHVHSFGQYWATDEVGHWHECTKCKEEQDYSAHVYDDDCDDTCNTCSYQRPDAHTYEEGAWQTSAFAHWRVCIVCGESSQEEKHIAGPEATEEQAQLCSVCGYELAPKLEHVHDFGTEYLTDELSHWQQCVCGELSVPADHVWDVGKETREDTIIYTCTVCAEQKEEAAPKSGISWVLVVLIILAVICLAGIGVMVYLLKTGAFHTDKEEDAPAFSGEEAMEEEAFAAEAEADPEEKMIDDFFSSLNDPQ